MEREVGGGIGMGNTCKPKAVSFQCMTKFTTNKKKKKRISHRPRKPVHKVDKEEKKFLIGWELNQNVMGKQLKSLQRRTKVLHFYTVKQIQLIAYIFWR